MSEITCYYFGVLDKSRGHQLYAGTWPVYEAILPRDFPVRPSALDGGFLPPRLPQKEGRAELLDINSQWTILTFWDRSADSRENSSSTFVIRGPVNFFAACEIARQHYPQVWDRFDFEVVERRLREERP